MEAYSQDGMHITYPGSEIIYTYIRSQLATIRLFDADSEGVLECIDNCPDTANPDQTETDGDALCGDVDFCPSDPYNDRDNDAVCGDVDNCPFIHNPAQKDYDGDGRGDACALCLMEQVYGSSADEAELLRRFRDTVLSKTPAGHELIKLYCQWSPLMVRALEEDNAFKAGTREMIDGIVPVVQEAME